MLHLMDNFVDEKPLNITATETTVVSDEEISLIKIYQKAMRKGRKKFSLKKFEYEILP